MKKTLVLFLFILGILVSLYYFVNFKESKVKSNPDLNKVTPGISKDMLFALYGKEDERTYRIEGSNEWITFNRRKRGIIGGAVTFYLKNNKVVEWKLDDREEIIKEYLGEFCSKTIVVNFPKMYSAIKYVLGKIPLKDFLYLTERNYPVLFTEYYYQDMPRFANSSEIIILEDDPPTFTEGLYFVKLSAELEVSGSVNDIVGVVAHELAHRMLGHSSSKYTELMEEEANNLVRNWGFEEELVGAKEHYQ